MSRDFPVNGLKELDAYLSALPKKMQKGAYRAGLTAAAAPIRDEARILSAQFSPTMARAIKTGSPRQNQDGTFSVSVRVDPKAKDAFLAWFGEYGVDPHLIARTGAKQGRVSVRKAAAGTGKIDTKVMKIGDDFVSGVISHPGHAAHPFMRPALDVKADDAIKAFAARIREYIEGKTGFAAPVDGVA